MPGRLRRAATRRSHSICRASTPARPGASWRATSSRSPAGPSMRSDVAACAATSHSSPRCCGQVRRGVGPPRSPQRPRGHRPHRVARVAERAQHVVVGAVVEPERAQRLQRRGPHLGVGVARPRQQVVVGVRRAGEANQLGDRRQIVGVDAGVRDERVRHARPQLADRLDDAGPLVARGVGQRPQQRRHAAGIAEMAERLDGGRADLLVRVVEAGEQRPQRPVRADQAERPRRLRLPPPGVRAQVLLPALDQSEPRRPPPGPRRPAIPTPPAAA